MSSEPPRVTRYNSWREWKPIISRETLESYGHIALAAQAIDDTELVESGKPGAIQSVVSGKNCHGGSGPC